MNKRALIIELNDRLRTTFKGGSVQMTRAVYNLDPQLRGRALGRWRGSTNSIIPAPTIRAS